MHTTEIFSIMNARKKRVKKDATSKAEAINRVSSVVAGGRAKSTRPEREMDGWMSGRAGGAADVATLPRPMQQPAPMLGSSAFGPLRVSTYSLARSLARSRTWGHIMVGGN